MSLKIKQKFENAYYFYCISYSIDYEKSKAYNLELELVNLKFTQEEIESIKHKVHLEVPSTDDYENGWELTCDILGSEDPNDNNYNGGWDNLPDK